MLAAVGSGVDAADGPLVDAQTGQVGDVLPVPGRADPPLAGRPLPWREVSTQAGVGQVVVDLDDAGVGVRDLFPPRLAFGLVPGELEVGPDPDQRPHTLPRSLGRDGGFLGEVPAFADLLDAQPPVAFGTRPALGREARTARHLDDLGLAGDGVDAPDRDRADADAVPFGLLPQRVRGERLAHPGSPGAGPWGGHDGAPGLKLPGLIGTRPALGTAVSGTRGAGCGSAWSASWWRIRPANSTRLTDATTINPSTDRGSRYDEVRSSR